MDLWATKTHSETEDEEAERLVHKAPKYKPPRHDRRRERMDTDRDPDIDADPDLKSDPDLSMNYKNIGGSTADRVASRFLEAKNDKIKVRHKDTGKVVLISEDTLREEGSKYEKVDSKEDGGEEVPENAEATKHGEYLRRLSEGNEKVQRILKDVLNPKSDIGGLAEGNPKLPASAILSGVKLPEGLKTIGDVVTALKAKAPKPKEKGKPSGEGAPSKPGEAPPSNKPKPKKKPKDKGEGSPAEEEPAPEPSEAEKAGVQPPVRRKTSQAERMEAANLIVDTFPEDVATELLAKNLHPDDVSRLVDTYHSAKQLTVKDPAAFAAKVAGFYEPNIDRIKPPPQGKNAAGELVAFDKLPPEEQSEAMTQHQIQVTALSLGAKAALTRELSVPSASGEPSVPPELAGALATFMLHKGDEKAAEGMSEEMFSTALTSASSDDFARRSSGTSDKERERRQHQSDVTVHRLMSRLSPAAKKLASAYFQATDYHAAKDRFLGEGSDQITERSNPKDIVRSLRYAKHFFGDRAKAKGDDEGGHRANAVFQVRVMDRLRALDPEKYDQVRQLMGREQKGEYDQKKAKFDKALSSWEKRKEAWEAKQSPYRPEPFEEPKPEEPPKPPLYHLAEEPRQSRKQAEAAIDEVLGRSKTASSVFRRFIFTYSRAHAMGQGSDKTGVYHGVDPMQNYPAPYAGWQQAHQRDLGESDFTTILGAAKEWLKSSVLSVAVEGITKDQQFRAALDLAIRDSKYAGQIQPTVYNTLLARLAGVKAPGLGQTLLTIREANSSFGPTKKGPTMKPSKELRKLAAKAVESNPKLAFEMIELAEQMESAPAPVAAPEPKTASAPVVDERYGKLRALVIHTAAVDATAKKVLLPVLQEIKTLG